MNHRIMKVSRMAQVRLNSCTTLEATETNPPEFQPVIGLEMHAQLSTPTKLFSASATIENPNIPSNSFVTKFDMAMPGTLPRLSRSCVEKSLLASILLNCEIADFCRFDRKHYFYPDLPLGYQITQKASPIAKNGHLDFFSQSEMLTTSQTSFEKRRIRIEQIQLEMDSGKTIRSAADDFLDLNRAGLALIEIVTAPNFCSPTEAICFVEHLRILLSENGVCAGLFHEGNLRVDANVSLSRSGQPGNKVELKNLSSIAHLHSAISKELDRQRNLLKRGECVQQETRAVDIHGNSVAGREKGAGMDYRFMPEPNLPPLAIQPGWVDMARQQAQLELPHLHFVQRYGFPPLFAVGVLKNTRLCQFIREYHWHNKFVPFAHLLPWLDELEFLCDKIFKSFPPIDADLIRCFAELVHLEFQGRLTKLVCIDLLKELASQEGSGDALEVTERIEKRQLWRIADPNEIEGLVQTVITEQSAAFLERLSQLRPEVVGRNRAFAKLKRMVIDKSSKRASPGDVEAAIWRQLGRNLKNH